MNLSKKKKLAKRALGIGSGRIAFVESRLEEIKDAITKRDIKDLVKSGAIIIKERKGRKTVQKHKSRSMGNIRKKTRRKKKEYMILTRKLRRFLKGQAAEGKVSKEHFVDIRKKIRNRYFRSKAHLKEYIGGAKK